MSEYEKMISGRIYDARDPELTDLRAKARNLLDRINGSALSVQGGERGELLRQLFGSVGGNLWLQPPFFCDYGVNISLGQNVFINFNCVFLDVAKITIGDAVQIGPSVQIYTATHPLEWDRRARGEEYGRPIIIHNDVWIGGGAIICPGVTIGEKSIIGAGAVVTREVPPRTVAAGNPARVIKEL